jgi:endonuclease-3 related protein
MSETSRLEQAAALLRAAYGNVNLPNAADPSKRAGLPNGESAWSRLLRALMGVPSGHPASETLSELLQSSPLATPRESAAASAGPLVALLQPIPRGPQKASVVRAVAAWWLSQFGDERSPDWPAGDAAYRESLRKIRGLGPATVDELLLFAASLPVFPVDRTALRVAVRHGWLDLPVDDEEAQSFFVRGMDQSGLRLQELSRLLSTVGETHCGREPKCEGCPLQSLLPEGGPRDPQSC